MSWSWENILKRTPPCGFVDIPGYEKRYYASRSGAIYSRITGKILVKNTLRTGYHAVKLRKHPWLVRRNLTVHRLVAMTFIGKCPSGREVDHKNRNKADDRVSNLRYVSRGHNMHNRPKCRMRGDSFCEYKGVSNNGMFWTANLKYKGRTFYCGNFDSSKDAARAYDRMATLKFGHLAATNKALGLL